MHDMVMNMVHDVMMHVMATFGLHGDRLSAISGSLCVSRSLLGARSCCLRGSG
ncbi:MAG: hypothetical protein ACREPW_00655 [Candidatus Binataceae bacterium]